MCGLIAILGADAEDRPGFRSALVRMHRRGPDGDGEWGENGVLLGHRRLAILDLDPRAAQPMQSACGRYVIVFNGEIYNFRELKRPLESDGVAFRTTSDTEVLLALFARDGELMLPQLAGMFAFVIWDRLARKAFAARDPYGIKPLYMATIDGGVMLASQVKALLATGMVSREPDPVGQAGFWMLGSVHEPFTWYRAIKALPAGSAAWIEDGRITRQWRWQDIGEAWRGGESVATSQGDIRVAVRKALGESVRRHLVADVPIGVFLSGGIDSGALAGLMVEQGARDLVGVTIGYDEFAGTQADEAPAAALLARHYGIRHMIRKVTREEFYSDLPRILDAMDQPSIDGINTWYASKAVAEQGLKVVVSGVGGDELFQGYSSFQQLPRLVSTWGAASRLPGAMPLARAAMGWQARRSGNSRWRQMPDWARTMAGAWWLRRGLFAPAELPAMMGSDLAAEGLQGFSPAAWVGEMSGALAADGRLAVGRIESTTYLRNQLLRDSDWASMDHSVELRTPLVDAWLLRDMQPILGAFCQFRNKRLLAEAPAKPLPEALINRPKTGFGIPVQTWLKEIGRAGGDGGPSHAWAREVAAQYSGAQVGPVGQ